MTQIRRISQSPQIKTPGKQLKQDAPSPGVTYSHVMRSGDAEETIMAILYLVEKEIRDKEGEKDGKGKKKKKNKKGPKKKVDEDKEHLIASPINETMVQPRKNGCAPTCLAMLLRKYGQVKTLREGYQKVESSRLEGADVMNDVGMTLENISKHAQNCGLKSRVQRGYSFLFQLEGLLRSLNRGATPIASVQLPGMGNMRHAVLIVGVTQHKVTIVDPAKAEVQELPMKAFQQEWAKEDKTQTGVGLSYVEVWGENSRGEVVHHVGWDAILEELTRDQMLFSEVAGSRRSDFPPVVHFFPD